MPDLGKEIDFTTDGEYAEYDEIKIVMTREQASAMADAIHEVASFRNLAVGEFMRQFAIHLDSALAAS